MSSSAWRYSGRDEELIRDFAANIKNIRLNLYNWIVEELKELPLRSCR